MGLLQVPAWLPYGVTQHVTGDNDPVYGVNGTINQCPKTLWGHIQALAQGIDTLTVEWVSASEIKVKSGGVCWADDGVQGYQLSSDVSLSLSSLDASSAYFVWLGDDGSGNIIAAVGGAFDASTEPASLSHPHLIPGWFLTDGSGDVIQFSPSLSPRARCGEVLEWPGTYPPYGAIKLEGNAVSRTGAPFDRAFSLFGTTYGIGDGSTTFNLPDKCGRCGIGAGQGSGLTNRALGDTVGEETHALTSGENASHTHTGPSHTHTMAHTHTGGAHVHDLRGSSHTSGSAWKISFSSASSNVFSGMTTESDGAVATSAASNSTTTSSGTGATGSSGSGTAHNTMQPSLVLNYVLAL